MSVLISAFVLGVACGLRAMVGLAAASWAANRQQLPLEGTWLSFLGFRFTPYIASLLAVGEIINDKLPKTPSRLVPPQFGGRVVMGALTGTAIGLSQGNLLFGALSGIVGKGQSIYRETVRARSACCLARRCSRSCLGRRCHRDASINQLPNPVGLLSR